MKDKELTDDMRQRRLEQMRQLLTPISRERAHQIGETYTTHMREAVEGSEQQLRNRQERGTGDARPVDQLGEDPSCEADSQLQSFESGKETLPAADANKRVVSVDQLQITPARTAEDIRRAVREGRFAEMTPGLAGAED